MVKAILTVGAAALLLAACQPQHKTMVIPDEMIARAQPVRRPAARADAASKGAPAPGPAPELASAAAGNGSAVLRLAEHGRSWEIELPDSSGGYELRLPMGESAPIEKPTAADQELLAAGARKAGQGKDAANAKPAAPQSPHAGSYLGSLARVAEMFSSKRYELALIEVVNLEAEYPQDERILAMKGTLFFKLGKAALAREAWLKAAALDPQDATVQEALRELGTEEAQ